MTEKPMRTQTADPYKIRCRDCIYRDPEVVKTGKSKVMIGIMRDTCTIFDGKKGNWKPSSVYFLNEDCPMYIKDDTAPKFWEE